MEISDVLVIGGGPAGLNASLYAARKALSVTLVSTDIGGQMMLTNEIENYLGFQSVMGIELAEKMEAHVRQYPVDFVTAGVKALKHLSDGSFAVQLDDGKSLQGKTVIVTAGKKSRTLDIPGEIEYTAAESVTVQLVTDRFTEIRRLRLWVAETVLCRPPLKCL